MQKKVAVIGAGAWGTAVATVLAHNGHAVTLWAYEQQVADSINERHTNDVYLPNLELPLSLHATIDIHRAIDGAEYVFEAVPVKYMRSVLEQAVSFVCAQQVWVVLSKGIEQETLALPEQVVREVLGESIKTVVLTGPSFAHEVVKQQKTGVLLASSSEVLNLQVSKLLHNSYFHVAVTHDVTGVQLCAALKNVIALGIGMLEGAGCGDNAKALCAVRLLDEVRALVLVCDGAEDSVYGLAGVGDIILTAFGRSGRNLWLGNKLGVGHSLESILTQTTAIPESVNTVCSVAQLAQKKGVDAPLFTCIAAVVTGAQTPKELCELL